MICSESFFKKPKLFEELQKASQLFFSFLSKFKKTLLIFHVFPKKKIWKLLFS